MTLRNNSEPEAALKEWLMATRPPAVVQRFLFYFSKPGSVEKGSTSFQRAPSPA